MKALLTIFALFLGVVAAAYEVPEYLKDGKIYVTLKSGKTYIFDTNEYMVVRRHDAAPAAEERDESTLAEKRAEAAPEHKMNRVRLLGGGGPTGIETSTTATSAAIKQTNGFVGGLGYDRMLNDTLSVGGQIQTNETYLLDLGVDF